MNYYGQQLINLLYWYIHICFYTVPSLKLNTVVSSTVERVIKIEISVVTIKNIHPYKKLTKVFELFNNIVSPSQLSLILFMLLRLSVANGGHDTLTPDTAKQQVYHQQHEQYSGDDDSNNGPTRQCRSIVTVNLRVPTFIKQ